MNTSAQIQEIFNRHHGIVDAGTLLEEGVNYYQLNQLVDRDARANFKNAPEEDAVHKLHFSLGRWIILNWGFYEGSRLSHSLKGMGIYHPDNMARFIIRSFHRSLNGRPIDVKGQLEAIAVQQEQDRQKRIQQGTVLYQETRKVKKDTVER